MDIERRSFMKMLPAVGVGAALAAGTASTTSAQEDRPAGSTYNEILKRGTIRLGVVSTEPWTYKDPGNSLDGPAAIQGNGVTWRGVGVFVAKAIGDALGVKVEPVETAWGTAVAGLQSNQFDIMFALDGTPVRAKAIDFLTTQIAWGPFTMITRGGNKAENWADFNSPSQTIAVVLGSAVDTFLTPLLKEAKLERFQETAQAVAAFQAGRVDVISGGLEGSILVGRLPGARVVIPKPLFAMPTGAGLRYDSDGRLKAYLETAVLYLYTSGQIQKAYEEFLSYRGLDPKKQIPIMRERIT